MWSWFVLVTGEWIDSDSSALHPFHFLLKQLATLHFCFLTVCGGPMKKILIAV